jgi:hypothetical protein
MMRMSFKAIFYVFACQAKFYIKRVSTGSPGNDRSGKILFTGQLRVQGSVKKSPRKA